MNDRELEDGDFDYEEVRVLARPGGTQMVINQPHDEELSISDSEQHRDEPDTLHDLFPVPQGAGCPETDKRVTTTVDTTEDTSCADSNLKSSSSPKQSDQESPTCTPTTMPVSDAFGSGYDHKQYDSIPVESSIKALFTYIGRYQPQRRQLETELKPFIPDYIAAVGDVDEFLKPPRPDGGSESLGLSVLDEHSAKQSDPAILRKLARSTMKGTAALAEDDDFHAAILHDDLEKDEKIDAWIQSVERLRDAQAVGEFKSMNRFSAIDTLMQAWPEELEPLVRNLHIFSAHVAVDITTLGEALCNLLDIPVYEDVLESLHWMFMLYLELKNNEMINPEGSNTMGAMENVNFYINTG